MNKYQQIVLMKTALLALLTFAFMQNTQGAESERVSSFNANEIFEALSVDSGFDSRRINLDIQFEINSDILTEQAKSQLLELATALKQSGISQDIFEIAGHTDSSGSSQHNLELSKRRANSTIRFLIQQEGISAKNLVATGYGERFPRSGRAAADVLNRRVEIINHGRWASKEDIIKDSAEKTDDETSARRNLNDLF